MSAANEFLEHLKTDVSMFYQVQRLGRDVPAIVAFAAEQGYQFTGEEFMEAVRLTRQSKEFELTPEEVEALARGEKVDDSNQDKHNWIQDMSEE